MSEGDNTRLCPLKIIIFATCLTGGQPNKYRTSTEQVPNKYRTSTEQVQDKYRTSTRQVPDKLDAVNPNIIKLVQIIGEQEMTVKDLMTSIGLKDRENFLKLYLNPAISEGYVRLLYPQSPRHPRQKYLLTAKGLEVLKSV